MPTIHNHGLEIHYELHGTGYPVLLLHGGTVNFKYNYADFGWIKSLSEVRMRVVGLDFRGHGRSSKPQDASSYGTASLASDALAVLDQLGLQKVALVGYSIGSAVALHLMRVAPERFDKAALVATGDGLIGHEPHTLARITPALALVLARTEYPKDLPEHLAAYWDLISATDGDKPALLAFSQGDYPALSQEQAAAISIPTLVVSGQNDMVLGRGPRLASALHCGEYVEVQNADHFSLAADLGTQTRVAQFLRTRGAVGSDA
jgi:pimeloyl-ACP methyl ester carboxylesterase